MNIIGPLSCWEGGGGGGGGGGGSLLNYLMLFGVLGLFQNVEWLVFFLSICERMTHHDHHHVMELPDLPSMKCLSTPCKAILDK